MYRCGGHSFGEGLGQTVDLQSVAIEQFIAEEAVVPSHQRSVEVCQKRKSYRGLMRDACSVLYTTRRSPPKKQSK